MLKARFGSIALMLLALFAGDRLLSFVLNQVVISSQFRLSRAYSGHASADVVLLGDSRAEHLARASELSAATGKQIFNLGLNGLSAQSTESIGTDYLERNNRPHVVIIEASNIILGHKEFTYPVYWHWSPRLKALAVTQSETLVIWKDIFQLSRFDWDTVARVLRYFRSPNEQDLTPIDGHISDAAIMSFQRSRPAFKLYPSKLDALTELVNTYHSKGVAVILLIAPFHQSQWAGDWHAILMSALQDNFSGQAEIVDLSMRLRGDESFVDPLHLNQHGRQLVLPALADAIARADASRIAQR